MKRSCARDWLMDSVMVMLLTGIVVFLLPLICAFFTPFHSIAMVHLLPHAIAGSLPGFAAAWVIRPRTLSLAFLPALLLLLFYLLYMLFGSERYPWGQSRHDFVMVSNWLLLLGAALFCAQIVLWRRNLARNGAESAAQTYRK
jgi:hypothetical protein